MKRWALLVASAALLRCAPENPSGHLVHGLVKDGVSGLPLPGVTVTVDGRSTVTGPLGEYGVRTQSAVSVVTADGRPGHPTAQTYFGVSDAQDFVLPPPIFTNPTSQAGSPAVIQGTVTGFTDPRKTQVSFRGSPLGVLPDSSGSFSFPLETFVENILTGALSAMEWNTAYGSSGKDYLLRYYSVSPVSIAAGQSANYGTLPLAPVASSLTFTLSGQDPALWDTQTYVSLDYGLLGGDLVAYRFTATTDTFPGPAPAGNGYVVEGAACDDCLRTTRAQLTRLSVSQAGGVVVPLLPAIAVSASNTSASRPSFQWAPVVGAQQYHFTVYDMYGDPIWEGAIVDPAAYGSNGFEMPIDLDMSFPDSHVIVGEADAYDAQSIRMSFHALLF